MLCVPGYCRADPIPDTRSLYSECLSEQPGQPTEKKPAGARSDASMLGSEVFAIVFQAIQVAHIEERMFLKEMLPGLLGNMTVICFATLRILDKGLMGQ